MLMRQELSLGQLVLVPQEQVELLDLILLL
jgi:hypothetical protein